MKAVKFLIVVGLIHFVLICAQRLEHLPIYLTDDATQPALVQLSFRTYIMFFFFISSAVVPFDILAQTGQYFPFATVFNVLLGVLFLMNIWWFYVSSLPNFSRPYGGTFLFHFLLKQKILYEEWLLYLFRSVSWIVDFEKRHENVG